MFIKESDINIYNPTDKFFYTKDSKKGIVKSKAILGASVSITCLVKEHGFLPDMEEKDYIEAARLVYADKRDAFKEEVFRNFLKNKYY